MSKFVIEPHFRLQEWVAEEKGYFGDEGLEYEFREFIRSTDGAHHKTVGKSGAFQSIEKGREVKRDLRMPLDSGRGGLQGPHEALCGRLFGGSGGDLRPGQFGGQDAHRPSGGADLGRVSIGQPLLHHPGA